MENDRVVMLKDDGFGKKGWIGKVQDEKPWPDSCPIIRVAWDNGSSYLHERRDIAYLDHNRATEPNLAFSIQKEKHKS